MTQASVPDVTEPKVSWSCSPTWLSDKIEPNIAVGEWNRLWKSQCERRLNGVSGAVVALFFKAPVCGAAVATVLIDALSVFGTDFERRRVSTARSAGRSSHGNRRWSSPRSTSPARSRHFWEKCRGDLTDSMSIYGVWKGILIWSRCRWMVDTSKLWFIHSLLMLQMRVLCNLLEIVCVASVPTPCNLKNGQLMDRAEINKERNSSMSLLNPLFDGAVISWFLRWF